MEKLVEEIIDRFERRKVKIENQIDGYKNKDNSIILLSAGQMIAFDFCINELKRLVEFYKTNKYNVEL